ncbi:MAG: CBS domain-containing protein [Geminicoccaceae bacterium]
MRISEVMTRNVCLTSPRSSLLEAAQTMAAIDAGSLPVGENERLVGMITDRDIAVRGVARGLGPEARVAEVMSPDVKYCYEDEEIGEVARNMAAIKVQRLPVLNSDKRLVGIVSLGDLAQHADDPTAGAAVSGIKEPGGPHSQSAGG